MGCGHGRGTGSPQRRNDSAPCDWPSPAGSPTQPVAHNQAGTVRICVAHGNSHSLCDTGAKPPTFDDADSPTHGNGDTTAIADARPDIAGNERGVEWHTLPTDRKIVALTFDAGSGDQGLARILKTLGDKNIPGTFFLTGQFVQWYPNDARAIAAIDMHSIGNHTWDHPRMNQLSDAAVRDEILSAERVILSVTGRQPWPLYRFPYGESSSPTIAIANSLGYGSIRWTVDTLGWEGTVDANGNPTGQSVTTVTTRALNAARPGEIVLMHVGAAPDGTTLDADALGAVIDGLRARNYSFVAIWDFIFG
jgi:peptidoglycan/xylan/chitin deacetylase (PgdA/CDA1 family)